MDTALRLAALLTDVRVTAPHGFEWRREVVELPRIDRERLAPDEVRRRTLGHLESRLYMRFYITGGRAVVPRAQPSRPWLSDLPDRLAAACGDWTRLETGWRQEGRDDGLPVLERDGLRIRARPDEIRPLVDGSVGLTVPTDLPVILPGFFLVHGARPEAGPPGAFDRFYWNLRVEAAVRFIRSAVEGLNGARVPFRVKVIADPAAFGRADAGLIVIDPDHRTAALPVLGAVHAELSAHLDPPAPAFTKRLAPGLGWAQGPADGASFGTSRCRIVAEALMSAYEQERHSTEGRLEAVRDGFRRAGLDLARPHLAPSASPDEELRLEVPPGTRLGGGGRGRHRGFLLVARELGTRLCDEAIRDGDRCTWLGPWPEERPGQDPVFVLRDLDPSLYDGTSGIGVFLAELATRVDDVRLSHTAAGAIRQALARRDDVLPDDRGGLFGGWVGVALAAARVGGLIGEPELLGRARDLVAELPDPPAHDVIDGRAGAILGLIALAELLGDPDLLGRATALSQTLAAQASELAQGAFAGAAHGAAGALQALDAAGDATTASAVLRAAVARRRAGAGISWCHGLSGIAPCLRGADRHAAVDDLTTEIREHVEEHHPDLSLCHGLLGAADALIELDRRRDPSAQAPALARRIGEVGIAAARGGTGPWPCGIPGEPPGLMLGLAGIGLGYLRLHDPQVASPLSIPGTWGVLRDADPRMKEHSRC